MKIITYNVNGIRSANSKGFLDWFFKVKADVVCIQEIKAKPEQLGKEITEPKGYKTYWFPAEKPGYSGTALFLRTEPDNIIFGCGIKDYDREGRIIRTDFSSVSLINVYFPSGTTGDVRQTFKYRFLDDFLNYLLSLRKQGRKLIVSGDYNICHKEIDIHNPVSNADSSGFLPEERAWVTKMLGSGFIDTFRFFNGQPHQYTWWSFRANARTRNLGWRIDYHCVSKELEKNLKHACHLPDARHSDHCPVVLEIDL